MTFHLTQDPSTTAGRLRPAHGEFQILVEQEDDCLVVVPSGFIDRRSAELLMEFLVLVQAALGSNGFYVRCGRTTGVSAEAYTVIASQGYAGIILAAANRGDPT